MRLFPLHQLLNKWIKQKVPYTWLHSLIVGVLFFGSLYLFAIPAEMYSRKAANIGITLIIIFYICLGFLSMNFKQKEDLVTVSGDLGKADFVSKN